MSNEYKGIPDLYDRICKMFNPEFSFYEWIFQPEQDELQIGQLCNAPVWYEKSKRWYLIEDNYDPIKEEDSTWKAIIYSGKTKSEREPQSVVAKYFELEKGENLFAAPGKYRPVILIRNYCNDWLNPSNQREHIDTWLCLPIFSYKERHNQDYVINDQSFSNPDRIYIPPSYGQSPGMVNESVIQLQSIQMLRSEYFEPLKSLCSIKEPIMNRPFKISNFAMKIIMYHLLNNFNIFDIFIQNTESEGRDDFILFVEEVKTFFQEIEK